MPGDRRGERQAAVRRRLAELDLDALLVSHRPNIRYLTGFTGSAGLLLLAAERTLLITDFRYASQAPEETAGYADVLIEAADPWTAFRRRSAEARIGRLGYEQDSISLRDWERIGDGERPERVPTRRLVESLRESKDPGEVAAIAGAGALAQDALAEVLATIRPGQTELEVAARLELALRARGSEWHPFETIVASGPRSALPHARATERPIRRGDLLLIDFGAILTGYCADLTRMAVVGAPADARQREIHGLVQSAQQRARTAIRAGMTGTEADALARDVISAAGYGEAFGHSLGHGVGLEVHEGPRLARTAPEPLPVGAVVTVEPGVYLPEWGGVRLEDDIHLATDGPRCLTDGRTELLELH